MDGTTVSRPPERDSQRAQPHVVAGVSSHDAGHFPAKWVLLKTPEAPFGAATLFDRARCRLGPRRGQEGGRDNGVPSTLK